ncbi:hypothetical protein VPNG_08349 [Cytospora leucostoma]|uniref:DUF7587 domain-containing protein n=1 Tax=Cytospora leucostoma TaxID=1230097 RepID=A0A423W9J5_9PEZI|nr:hypothetical protein VPNG_08349 [Cytospora leucostoma]
MDDRPLRRDIYDLNYERSIREKLLFGDSSDELTEEARDQKEKALGMEPEPGKRELSGSNDEQRGQPQNKKGISDADFTAMNKRSRSLNHLSKELRRLLEKKDAIVICLFTLSRSLEPAPDRETNTILPPGRLYPNRPDGIWEEENLRARLKAAQEDLAVKLMAESLRGIGRFVSQSQSHEPWQEGPSENLFYRVTRVQSHTFYADDIGFCCGRWLRKWDFREPSEQDLIEHVGGINFESPYISLTESPYRALRLVPNGFERYKGFKVMIIDATILRASDAEPGLPEIYLKAKVFEEIFSDEIEVLSSKIQQIRFGD